MLYQHHLQKAEHDGPESPSFSPALRLPVASCTWKPFFFLYFILHFRIYVIFSLWKYKTYYNYKTVGFLKPIDGDDDDDEAEDFRAPHQAKPRHTPQWDYGPKKKKTTRDDDERERSVVDPPRFLRYFGRRHLTLARKCVDSDFQALNSEFRC